MLNPDAYSTDRERGFHAIVNTAVGVGCWTSMFYSGVHDGSRPAVKPGFAAQSHAVTCFSGFRIDSPGIFGSIR
jgi:hypothetical protein